MYSLVLMTALAAPGQDPLAGIPAAGPVVIGCGGCYGGCTSYSCGGCYSYSCGGCYGSCYGQKHCIFGHHAGCHGLFGHRHSCSGCCGYSCSGWSCFGSCTGYSCGGCGGCYGSSWAAPVYYSPSAVYGTVTNMNPPVVVPAPVTPTPVTPPVTGKDGKMGANVKFQLPADAKLFVDGRLTNLTGAERSFVTPPLGAGKFFYEVKAELMVDGRMVVEQKRVVVEAGVTLVESFPKLFAAIDGKGDPVAGK
ncbi:MAG: TIGR03000 domain-containing protein [Planctomycetes bacterium]|nr:TIGR03000 domain-containing protein [Planctomycetota bacterium]